MSRNLTLLSDLAVEINKASGNALQAANAARCHADNALDHGFRVGELLLQAKAQCRHGEFGRWIADNLTVSERQAQTYMRLARNRPALEQIRSTSDLSMRTALELLAPPEVAVTVIEVKPGDTGQRDRVAEQASPTVEAHRARIAQPEMVVEPVATTSTTEPDIFERMFGPLSGVEWAEVGQDCWRRKITRGPYKRPGRYSEAFLKLAAHFRVPLAELDAAE